MFLTELVEGEPKSQIIDIANEWYADMIVLGSHGRTGLDRFLIGQWFHKPWFTTLTRSVANYSENVSVDTPAGR